MGLQDLISLFVLLFIVTLGQKEVVKVSLVGCHPELRTAKLCLISCSLSQRIDDLGDSLRDFNLLLG